MNFVRAARVLASLILMSGFYALPLLAAPKNVPEKIPGKISAVQVLDALYGELIADPLEDILPAVIKALNQGAPFNGRFNNAGRDTPLTHAAGFGQLPAIKLFLERGARVNQANDDGQTPLWNAAETGMLEAQDTSDISNFKPATQAQIQKRREIYTDIVRTLLKYGAQTEIAATNMEKRRWNGPLATVTPKSLKSCNRMAQRVITCLARAKENSMRLCAMRARKATCRLCSFCFIGKPPPTLT